MPQLTTVRVSDIKPDPDNIRDNAADADIDSLAADIAEHGLLQPLVVYPDDHGALKLSAGHRRWHAITALGWSEVAVIIRKAPASDLERIDLMTAENLHRRNLNPIEEAKLFQRYLDLDVDPALTHAAIAKKIGRSISHVTSRLALLELSDDMQRRIADGSMTVSRAIKAVKWNRVADGRSRADHGQPRQQSIAVPHFNSGHRLYIAAANHCAASGHDPSLRLGGACGECWERQIRIDAGVARSEADPPPSQRASLASFADPMEILRRLKCSRCGTPAVDRNSHACFTVRDGKRVLAEHHEFRIQVAADAA